jgi:hypothetical protein
MLVIFIYAFTELNTQRMSASGNMAEMHSAITESVEENREVAAPGGAEVTEGADRDPGPPAPVSNTGRGRGGRGGGGRGRGRQPTYQWWLGTIAESSGWVPPTILPRGLIYITGQLEIGETTGFRHWQVCFQTTNKVTLGGAQGIIGAATAHVEPSRSEAAREYSNKEETRAPGTVPFMVGAVPCERNSKRDHDRVRELAKKGRFDEIDSASFLQYYKTLHEIHRMETRPKRRDNLQVIVFWGNPGTGKTHRAWEETEGLPNDQIHVKQPNKWWDGYCGHQAVILDDFGPGIKDGPSIHLLKTWMDKFPVSAEVKGGTVALVYETLYITSNVNPRYWFPGADENDIAALLRRITRCWRFTKIEETVSITDETAELPRAATVFGSVPPVAATQSEEDRHWSQHSAISNANFENLD